MKRLIHLEGKAGNYAAVTDQINSSISKHLPVRAWTSNRYLGRLPRQIRMTFGLFARGRQHVLMSHGVADKNYLTMVNSDGDLYVNSLEHLLVPGPWQRDKLLAHPQVTLTEDQISSVGWPRLDLLLELQKSRTNDPTKQPKLLWAPTHDWRKNGKDQVSTSSYPEFSEDFERLGAKYPTDISLHPRNRSSKTPTSIQLIDADIVISDFGTMVYEAWALGKPVIFPSWLIGDRICEYLPGSAEAYIFENKVGYHPRSAAELRDIIDAGPVITPDVTAFLETYLPAKFAGVSGREVAQKLLRLAGHS